MTIYSEFSHEKLLFSIAVKLPEGIGQVTSLDTHIEWGHLWLSGGPSFWVNFYRSRSREPNGRAVRKAA